MSDNITMDITDETPIVQTPVEETAPVEEPAPVEETAPVEEPAPEVVVNTTQNNNSLEERVRVLEERLDKLIAFIKTGNSMPESYVI